MSMANNGTNASNKDGVLNSQFQLQSQHRTQGGSPFAVQATRFPQGHPQTAQARRSHLQSQEYSLLRNIGPGTSNPSPVVSTPAAGGSKRAQQKPPSRSSTPSTSCKTMEVAPASWRKKLKLPNEKILEKLDSLVPESVLYSKLLELESRIDASITRKKSELMESVVNGLTLKRTLRIYVFNTFSNQEDPNLDDSKAGATHWTLKIVGSIIEGDCGNDISHNLQRKSWYPKFSYFFKRITVYLDKSLYPDDSIVVVWERDKSSTFPEGFKIKREGNREFKLVIRFDIYNIPEKLKLSQPLAEILRVEVDTYSRVIAALWQYIKMKKLQDPHDHSLFVCDLPLRKVFGEEKMRFGALKQKLLQHLSALQPIEIEHTVKLAENCPSGATCYDMLVDMPLFSENDVSAALESFEMQEEIDAYDRIISSAAEKLHEHYCRHAFFSGFTRSPTEFINTLVASQGRDLKLAAGEAGYNAEKECQSGFFTEPWVEDAIARYMSRRVGSSH